MRRFLLPLFSIALLTISAVTVAVAGVGAEPLSAGPLAVVAQQPGGPVAQFSYSFQGQPGPDQLPRVHDMLLFDATASQGVNLGYTWTFGDGTPPVGGPKVAHAFGMVDDFTVTLTVGNATGQTASTNQSLRIVPIVDSLVAVPPLKQVVPGASVPITLYIQAPGPGNVNAGLSGDLLSSKPTPFSTQDALAYLTFNAQVPDERNATIDQQIIRTPGGSIPLQGNVLLQLTYQTSAGKNADLTFHLSLQKDRDASKGIWAITYPNFSLVTGTTDPTQPDVGGYYLKGDPGFHHPDDPLVRKYAMQAARAGGGFPSDPAQVMENLYTFVGGLFGSDDPASIEPDDVIVQKIARGALVPGQRSEKYICISQTYFLASLTRTLGLASRELTIALANPVSQNSAGAWRVSYVQEGATEIWFDNSWHLYDTWLRIRKLDDYLIQKYAYQAWYSYSAQEYDLRAKNGDRLGLFGHDFAIGENEGTPADPAQWYLRDLRQRSGVVVVDFPTS